MKTYAVVLKPFGNQTEVTKVEYDSNDTLNFFYKNIGCDCIGYNSPHRFKGLEEFENIAIVYDDEFWLKNVRPEINRVASYMYGIEEHGEPILGNVVVCKTGHEDFEGFTGKEIDKIVERLETIAMLAEDLPMTIGNDVPKFEIYSFGENGLTKVE